MTKKEKIIYLLTCTTEEIVEEAKKLDQKGSLFAKNNSKTGQIIESKKIPGKMFKVKSQDLEIEGSCRQNCRGCYACKSCAYHWDTVLPCCIITQRLIKEAPEVFKRLVIANTLMERVFRFNESGDIETLEELKLYNEIAKARPHTQFLVYTENHDLADMLKDKAENLMIRRSYWWDGTLSDAERIITDSAGRPSFIACADVLEAKKTFKNVLICPCSFNTKDHKTTCSKCGNCFFSNNLIFEKIH